MRCRGGAHTTLTFNGLCSTERCSKSVTKYVPTFALMAALAALSGSTATARELPDFTGLVEQYSASVVNVASERPRIAADDRYPDELEEFFRRFMPMPEPREHPQSMGSGFIISEDGYILTNNHVVEGAESITIRLIDRREFEAELIGTDPRSDLAVLKVDAKDLPAVKIGRSETLDVGEWVLAIGSPFGFDYSVTAGIVSAKRRSLPNDNRENYVPFIQTDVAINPGNSGGPLFNLDGEVVGINSQIYTRSGGFMGVSFAIPIDVAMEVADQLRDEGRVSRGWLGVLIQEVDKDLANSFGLDKPQGALVSEVLQDGPAADSDLQAGDVIIEFDGTKIDRSGDLPHLVGRARSGTQAELTVMRDGEEIEIDVVIGELPDGDAPQIAGRGGRGGEGGRLGLVVEQLEPAVAERMGIDGGVHVISAEGAARTAGIRRGDIITRLNNQNVDSVATFGDIAEVLAPGKSVAVLVVRGKTPSFFALKVPD